jgi:UPF0716 protein FxsA
MSLVKWGFIGLLLLPLLELGALLLVAALLGWLATFALFIGTSVIGALLLRRSGRADFDRLRSAVAQDGLRALNLRTPGLAAMLGGILLVFPGFITDVVGALLLLPAFRRWAASAAGKSGNNSGKKSPTGHQVIDLEPTEWRQLPDRKPKRGRKPKGQA